MDEILTNGYINQLFKQYQFKKSLLPPTYLIKMISKWYSQPMLHVFYSNPIIRHNPKSPPPESGPTPILRLNLNVSPDRLHPIGVAPDAACALPTPTNRSPFAPSSNFGAGNGPWCADSEGTLHRAGSFSAWWPWAFPSAPKPKSSFTAVADRSSCGRTTRASHWVRTKRDSSRSNS